MQVSSRMPSSGLTLPVVRRAHLKPYADFLHKIGAPVDRYLQRAKLPIRHEPAAEYVSNRGYFEFVGIAAREQGIPDFGFRACMRFGRTRLSPEVVRRIERSPTLYSALKGFCADIHQDASHVRMGLIDEPDRALFWHRSTPEAGPVGWEISEQLVACLVIDIVRHFAGPRWYPAAIGCRATVVPKECREHLPKTKLVGGGHGLSIPVPRSLLHLPPWLQPAVRVDTPGQLHYPRDFPTALREVLKGYLSGGSADLSLAADIVGTSPRTLQRRLKEAGTSFSRVLERARYETAASLLADPRVRTTDVARASGYSDPSNFARAFRRTAGSTPSEYRDSIAGAK